MRAADSISVFNVAASSATGVKLVGGKYMISAVATWGGGNLDLHMLGPDNSTYLSVLPATFTANGVKTIDLPQGTYKFIVTTATALYAAVVRIPGE